MSVRFVALVTLVISLTTATSMAQRPASKVAPDSDVQKIAADCVAGKGPYTTQQCAFFQQFAKAERLLNGVVDSGEFAKLPKASQAAMFALVDALQATMPLMKR